MDRLREPALLHGSDAWVVANWAADPSGAPHHRGMIAREGRRVEYVECGPNGEVLRSPTRPAHWDAEVVT